MVENIIRQTSKKTWYKWSVYINIVLFFIVALFIGLLVRSFLVNPDTSSRDLWISVSINLVVIAIALALIFYQFFRNLFTIMRRSL
ncbi:MAG: hypothetical protein JSV67_08870 [Thermoplasmatales archaeon]|jgi:hypothetical protein|nr:MAG: hypothetical protein JSV67_08870 [Thermoplasmatales archaeon]